jgi:hypothetical protein
MAWGKSEKPSFKREEVSYENAVSRIADPHFLDFLKTLDWTKTAMFYEEENGTHSGQTGWRVVHFKEKVEEKWHNVWGMTWVGISSWMS